MANVEGDSPSSDKLKAHADEPAPVEPVAPEDEDALAGDMLAHQTDEDADAPLDESTEGEPSETEAAEEAEAAEEGAEWEKESRELPPYLEWAGVFGIPLIVLAIAAVCALSFSSAFSAFSWAIYLIALSFIPYGIWKGRETNTIYTAFLGCALAGLLTATFCLWLEMGQYQFNVKARDKQRIGMSQDVQFGPASTTAAA